MTPNPPESPNEAHDRSVAGILLIVIGLLVFASMVIDLPNMEHLVLPGLALIFLAWGLLTREFGLIIPGGVLAGIALGTYLLQVPFTDLGEQNQGGVFLVAFSVGWALISLLSLLTRQGFQWWPLIPGGIIGLVGLALLRGGAAMRLLELAGYAWPLILVAVGASLLLRRRS
ncbi:MAG: hypothetical protein WAZ19_08210 [Anaerolineae bacterium]